MSAVKKFFKYFRDAIKELSFVTWPKKDVLIQHAIIVLCVTLVFALAFWLIDGGMRALIGSYISATEPFRGTGTTMSGTTLPASAVPGLGNIQLDTSTGSAGVQTIPVTQ